MEDCSTCHDPSLSLLILCTHTLPRVSVQSLQCAFVILHDHTMHDVSTRNLSFMVHSWLCQSSTQKAMSLLQSLSWRFDQLSGAVKYQTDNEQPCLLVYRPSKSDLNQCNQCLPYPLEHCRQNETFLKKIKLHIMLIKLHITSKSTQETHTHTA